MNDKQQFYNEFYSTLEKAMEPRGGRLIEMDIPKNNGSMKGITIKFNNSLAPTVYPDFYYQDWQSGQSMNDIVSKIRSEFIKTAPELSRFSINSLSRSSATTHLQAAVVGYENNREWLKNVPHERIADLAVFAKWRTDTAVQGSIMTAKITEPLLAHLKLTKEEALKMAKANTAKSVKFDGINDVMRSIIAESDADPDMAELIMFETTSNPFHVLSTKSGIDGAALIACPEVLKAVRKQIDEDFYILPSSIHEILVVPKSETDDIEGLKEMVSSINETDVEPEDRLSDQVYEFDGHSLKIAGAELTQERNIADTITYHKSR